MKRIVKIIIALVIAICVSTSINVWRADAKVKRIVLKVGDSKKVSVLKKNKKYSFSKKAIIKINKKGKIVALKKGKTKIYYQEKMLCNVIVKNSYFAGDFSKADKLIVRNLQNGETGEFSKSEIDRLQNKVNKNKYYRAIETERERRKKGGYQYSFSFYDKKGKMILQLAVGNKEMKYYSNPEENRDCTYYRSAKKIDFNYSF